MIFITVQWCDSSRAAGRRVPSLCQRHQHFNKTQLAYVSVIPANAIGDACIGELRRQGIDTSHVARKSSRRGIYFLEAGPASGRPWSSTTGQARRSPRPAAATGPGSRLIRGDVGCVIVFAKEVNAMIDHQRRARNLVRRMTVKEKVAQLCAVWLNIEENGTFSFREASDGFITQSLGNPETILKHGIGQITRPLGTRPIDPVAGVRGLNKVQKYLVESTRLGIPALAHEECLPGLMAKGSTLFPTSLNYGSLWDEELARKIGAAIGAELYSAGSRQGLAPVLDVSRDARWGRTEETFGEDPYLAGCLAVAYVKGLQGEDRRVLATLKHFVGHSFSEGGRNHAPVRVGERELADVFLLPFEMAVKLAHAGAVMPAYHDLDGEPLSSSRRFLTGVLRETWGFDGIIVSDYEAIRLLFAHHRVALDEAEASALAVEAGIDAELPGFTCFGTGIEKALDRGILSMKTVDAAVRRILVEKSRLGLFEKPYADEGAITLGAPEHRQIAAEAAARSIVLLKNDGLLPLQDEGTTALVGPQGTILLPCSAATHSPSTSLAYGARFRLMMPILYARQSRRVPDRAR